MPYFQPEQPNDFSSHLPAGFSFDTQKQFLTNFVIKTISEHKDFNCFRLVKKNKFTIVVVRYRSRLWHAEKIIGCIDTVDIEVILDFLHLDPLPGSLLYEYKPRFYKDGVLQHD